MFRSLPALRRALSLMEQSEPTGSAAAAFEAADLVCAYRVPGRSDVAAEAKALAAAVATLADRVVRLESAYSYWEAFEAGPYFDLHATQAAMVCQVEEAGGLVRVRIYADLLAPSFRAAERFCVERFLPAVRASHAQTLPQRIVHERELVRGAWRPLQIWLSQAEQVIDKAVTSLLQAGDVSFLVTWGAAGERQRADVGDSATPTLTLDFTFSRPLSLHPRRQYILRRRMQRRQAAGRPLLRRSGPGPFWRRSTPDK